MGRCTSAAAAARAPVACSTVHAFLQVVHTPPRRRAGSKQLNVFLAANVGGWDSPGSRCGLPLRRHSMVACRVCRFLCVLPPPPCSGWAAVALWRWKGVRPVGAATARVPPVPIPRGPCPVPGDMGKVIHRRRHGFLLWRRRRHWPTLLAWPDLGRGPPWELLELRCLTCWRPVPLGSTGDRRIWSHPLSGLRCGADRCFPPAA